MSERERKVDAHRKKRKKKCENYSCNGKIKKELFLDKSCAECEQLYIYTPGPMAFSLNYNNNNNINNNNHHHHHNNNNKYFLFFS